MSGAKLTEEQRQALLRFADFESQKLEMADDSTLVMVQLALYKLYERDPARVLRILAGALSIYGRNVSWVKAPRAPS